MITTRTTLSKSLRTLAAFDPKGTPFIGAQIRGEAILFHRSSPNGFMQTLGYNQRGNTTVVSLAHMQDCLQGIQDERIDITKDAKGILRLQSVESIYSDDLRVHTINDTGTWAKRHDCGAEIGSQVLDPGLFSGLSINPFTLATPPVLKGGRIMLATDHGIIMRSGMAAEVKWFPRETLIRSLGSTPDRLFITDKGYWGAVTGGMEVMVAGHALGDNLFRLYNGPATVEIEIPASRLLFALSSAADLCSEASSIRLDPKTGITTQDQFRNPAAYSLGTPGNFIPLHMTPKTANTIVAALSQAKDEMVQLSVVSKDTRRLSRGDWEVNFRTLVTTL